MTLAYKVLLKENGKLYPGRMNKPKYLIEYTPGEITYPIPQTYLFVFDDLKVATRFYREYTEFDYELWLCEADIVDIQAYRPSTDDADIFWKLINEAPDLKFQHYMLFSFKLQISLEVFSDSELYSMHTRFARSLKLLEKIM